MEFPWTEEEIKAVNTVADLLEKAEDLGLLKKAGGPVLIDCLFDLGFGYCPDCEKWYSIADGSCECPAK